MDSATQNKVVYRGQTVKAPRREKARADDSDKPMVGLSSYAKNFPNWKNGKGDIFHEKQPQYPFYSLPFKGNSMYKQSFTEE